MKENFGLYLKHERELRGVPLEEIAEATKVHIRYLEALENNNFDELPGEVFIKGYIRSYAKAIGYNVEEMINAYDDSVGKNRKEELQGELVEKRRIQSRNKKLARFAFLGIVLVGMVFFGAMAIEIVTNKKEEAGQARLSPSMDASSQDEESGGFPVDPASEESDETGEMEPALENDQAQISSEVDQSKTKTTNAPKEKASPPPSEPDKAPRKPQPAREKTETTAVSPKPEIKRPSPAQEKTASPKNPVESEVKEKNSESSEKEVIIQQVGESSGGEKVAAAVSDSESENKPLHLLIQVQGNSWFNLTTDEAEEKDFILPGGTSKSFYANENFRITIGNRRGTKLFLNGESLDLPPGNTDVIRDLKITANLAE